MGLAERVAEAEAPAGRVRERVVEGRERLGARDVQLERLVEPRVGDGDLHPVGRLAPEERDLEAVALAGGELTPIVEGDRRGIRGEIRCAHGSSSPVVGRLGLGVSTSLTHAASLRRSRPADIGAHP